METERYPADLVINITDFNECGWKEALATATRKTYCQIHDAFSTAARQAMENGQQKHGKALFLLAEACSMMLQPESPNVPFKPFLVLNGVRSPIPEDFSEADLDFFAEIIPAIDDCLVKARLADLIWLLQRRRGINFALTAIDAYMEIPLAAETWHTDVKSCWARAVTLARQIGKGAGDRLQSIGSTVFQIYESAIQNDNFWALNLAIFLLENQLVSSKEQAATIAGQLKAIAATYKNKEIHKAVHFYQTSGEFFKTAGDTEQWADTTVEIAEACAYEADKAMASNPSSGFITLNFYEKAIQTYRDIPKTYRAKYQVDEKLQELQTKLEKPGKQTLTEMIPFNSPRIDVTDLIDNYRKAVRGKTFIEALMVFCNLFRPPQLEKLRAEALSQIKKYPLTSIFSGQTLSKDGRVIAKRPALDLNDEKSKNNEVIIRESMIRNYGMLIDSYVRIAIMPALEELLLEHRVQEADFINIVQQSPIAPRDRVRLLAKALFYGYERDFVIALHLLAPQIENIVRVSLKSNGVSTTTLDSCGIETEKGLSTLMEIAGVDNILGEDLSFELKALFCDPFGPNLRNELAHGLIDDLHCYSAPSIYAWWRALRLVLNTSWKATQSDIDTTTESVEQ